MTHAAFLKNGKCCGSQPSGTPGTINRAEGDDAGEVRQELEHEGPRTPRCRAPATSRLKDFLQGNDRTGCQS